MKIKSLFAFASVAGCVILSLFSLASCGSKQEGKALADYNDIAAEDSLLYYYGQLRAQEYRQLAINDTNLRTPQEKEAFLRGVRDGFKMVGDDEAYNRGVRLGVRMHINLQKFEERYDVDLDDDILLQSMAYGVYSKTDIPSETYQKQFYKLLGKMRLRRTEEKRGQARQSLVEEARKLNLAKISDDLYFRIERKGEGPNAEPGDVAYVSVAYRYPDGKDIGMPTPNMVNVGVQGMPSVMTEAFTRLNKGAKGVFATSAYALFGSRTEILGLNPADVVIVTISVSNIGPDTGMIFDSDP